MVHHKDKNKSNSQMSNLKLVNRSEQNKYHKVWAGNKNPSRTMSHKERSRLSKLGWKHRRK
jgi:hypothetical protein